MRQFVTALILCYPLLLWSQSDTTVTVFGESGIFPTDANNPTVDWLTPDGGEVLETDEAFNGTWDASDENIGATPISISFSLTIGDTFYVVVLNEPDNSFVSLTAPSTPTDYLRIKITARDLFGNESHDYSQGYIAVGTGEIGDTTTTISDQSIAFIVDSQNPVIELVAPVGGEEFLSGQQITGSWNASDLSFGATPISIGLTAFIGDTIRAMLDGISNSGGANFNLPTIDTRFARVHIYAKDDFGNLSMDASAGYITIGSPPGAGLDSSAVFSGQSPAIIIDANNPFVDLFTPNGGETYLEETNFNVSWAVTDELLDTNSIAIFMSTAIGGFFDLQIDSLADDGQEVITAPLGPVEYGQIRLTAKDDFGNVGQDQSIGYFSVFESGTGAIQGNLHVDRAISGILYLALWFPGHDPEIHGPDREQPPFPVNFIAGDTSLYSFANLLPGSGYAVRAFIDQVDSDNSGIDSCDYGYDLSGYSSFITVTSDLVSVNTDIDLVECENFNNGDFSMNFDGIDDYLEIPDASALNPDTALTICTWIFPQAWNENGHVISKGIANNQYSLKADTNQFVFEINGSSGSIQMSLPPFGVWTFISAVFKNNRLDLYGNGILQSSTDVTGPLNTSPDPLIIGRRSPGSPETDSFNGLIDYISIWNRGLTSAEIISVMENGVDSVTANNLSGYWNFVEGVVNTVHDESFASNHGTIHGALWDTTIHFIGPDLPPQNPQNITVVSGDHSAHLYWLTNPEYDISHYSVFRDITPDSPQFISQVNHPISGFSDSGLENGRTYYYWLTAVDLTGNVSDTVGAVSVEPNGAPIWTGLPDTSFYEDDSLEMIIAPYVFDDSDPDSTLNILVTSGGNIYSNYDPLNYRLVLWAEPNASGFDELIYLNATDPYGLSAQDSFNVSVTPVNDPPVITSPLTASAVEDEYFVYQADGFDLEGTDLTWVFQGLPSWLNATADSVYGTPLEGDPNTSFGVIASDGSLQDTAYVYIMVEPVNDRPVIISPPAAVAVEDQLFYYLCQANDPEDSTITWIYPDLPAWLTASADSIYGVAENADTSTTFRIIANDGELFDTMLVVLTIQYVNDPPVITSPSATSAVEGYRFIYQATGSDPDDTVFDWTFTDLPSWLASDADSLFGTPYENAPDTSFSIHLSDGELVDTLVVAITIIHINNHPIITSPTVAAAREDEYFIYRADGNDPEGLALSWDFDLLPNWLSADSDTVFGFPREGDPDTHFRVIVSDGSLNDSIIVQVTVQPVNDQPVIVSSNNALAVEDLYFSYQCQATDPEDSPLVWTYFDLPHWLTANADSVFGTPSNFDIDTSFSIIASDGELSDTLLVTLTIQYVNDPPVLELILDQNEKHGQFEFFLSVYDEEQAEITLTFTYSLDNTSWSIPDISALDNQFYRWNTSTDLPGQYQPQVWLKIEGSDVANTTVEISPSFAIDNHVGSLQLSLITAGFEFSDQVDIPFQINDSTADIYDLQASFSIDGGVSWQTATVSGTISAIRPTDYSSSLVWESRSDLPDNYIEAQIAVLPTDGWQVGRGDTLLLLIDNQALSLLTDYTPGLSEEIDWYSPFQLEFSLSMDSQTFADGIQVTGDHQGFIPVSFTYNSTVNAVTVIPDNWYYATDSVRITMNSNLKDITGDPFDANGNGLADGLGDVISIPFGVGLLADYNDSGLVEFEDLVIFCTNWDSVQVLNEIGANWDSAMFLNEIGPAVGIPPLMQIQPDSSFDFEDLMVFVQMWNWSAGFENDRALLAKSSTGNADLMDVIVSYPKRTSPSSPEFITLTITLDSTVVMGALETIINYDPAAVVFDEVNFHLGKNWIKLTYTGQDATIIINAADLQRNPDDPTLKPFNLRFHKKTDQQTSIDLQADIRNRDGNVISVLKRNYQFATTPPLPTNYALHQNYPNPFNPLTNIKYELPNDSQVKMTIYNLLGQEVRVLLDSWQPAGYHLVQWNGLNNSNHAVSGGVYLLRIETKSFNAVRKLILLK
ncbi:MAG: T9SS type A sorting domain-containing protein [Candidatus Marinimicrobia bacterium]|nr:T9SS type A sorting domain-containing protein [Candidatus Neomarinimicrobiota bacterium]